MHAQTEHIGVSVDHQTLICVHFLITNPARSCCCHGGFDKANGILLIEEKLVNTWLDTITEGEIGGKKERWNSIDKRLVEILSCQSSIGPLSKNVKCITCLLYTSPSPRD